MFRAMNAQHDNRVLNRKCLQGQAGNLDADQPAIQILEIDGRWEIAKGALGVHLDPAALAAKAKEVMAGRNSVPPGVRFPRIKHCAISGGLQHGNRVWNIFLLDGKIQVLINAPHNTPIAEPGKNGTLVWNHWNPRRLKQWINPDQLPKKHQS